MMFADRIDAADKLASALTQYKNRHALVLGIPRGGVPMACRIAEQLAAEVDVVLVRKLPAPGNPEYAIGSVDETGWLYLNPDAGMSGTDGTLIEAEKARQLDIIMARRKLFTAHRASIDPAKRVVIVVDDGLATGSTMIAALHSLRARGVERLICAVPVAPPETLERVRPYCDEVVCLEIPRSFYAVGQFYRDFPQVSDEEVVRLLSPQSAG
ncbi:MAG: phosphoribosyltransferase family protein [Burkholderiales bacterium]